MISAQDVPLCIDLDGTLIRSDLLAESALSLLARNPLYLFPMAGWLLHGRAHLKRRIAERSAPDVAGLPYDGRVLEWLRGEAGSRRRVLCTASDQKFAEAVAAHVGCFDMALGSDGNRNLSGSNKAETLCSLYGEGGFDYAGNSWVDLAVWKHARCAIVVNASAALVQSVQRKYKVERVFPSERTPLRSWIKALRLYQWLKNALLFLPLLAAHRLLDPMALANAAVAFLSFGLCASGTYLLNDLLDLSSDRRHPRKRKRPFASGALPLQSGMLVMPLLIGLAFILASLLSLHFTTVLLCYLVITLAYSFRLKRVVMLDVVVLAALYTVRIVAGTAAIHVDYSFWLLAFSMFIFLSLAMLKRYTELLGMLESGQQMVGGRGYAVDDLPLIQSLGGASGYISVLVLALYINSTASELLYRHPHVLWMLCPLLLYWISRAWVAAHRKQMHDDPIVFAVTDRVSQVCLVLVVVAMLGAL
jgi:4-hydroxybenzoate polyprenyltransferase